MEVIQIDQNTWRFEDDMVRFFLLESSLDRLISMKDEYDFIYASHDEFMLPNDYAEKVKAVWKAVRNGEIPFEQIDLFGNSVRSYTAADCGFFGSNG